VNSQESDQVFELLENLLNQLNLNWVVSQVNQQIRLGQAVQQEVETIAATDLQQLALINTHRGRQQVGRRATLQVIQEYNSQERLLLLLDAIKQSVPQVVEIQQDLLNFVKDELGEQSSIMFAPDEANPQIVVINLNDTGYHLQPARRLTSLFDELKVTVNNGNER